MSKSGTSTVLVSPLNKFESQGLLKFEPETDGILLAKQANNLLVLENCNEVASELLSVQAELLTKTKVDGNRNASYEGLILYSSPIHDPKGIRIDCYDADCQSIKICPNNTSLKLSEVLAHEMTHAIDDIYDDRKSGDRVLSVFACKNNGEATDMNFQKTVINQVSNLFPRDLKNIFKKSYVEGAIKGSESYTKICELAEQNYRNGCVLTNQERSASLLLGEFASFTIVLV